MITLLGKYHAYAPPFKYEGPSGTYVGGIEGRVEWTEDLQNQLRVAWDDAIHMGVKVYEIPSAHRKGVMYLVTKMLNGWTCTCPARGNCWHIKYAKQIDFVSGEDTLEYDRRSNDYRDPI